MASLILKIIIHLVWKDKIALFIAKKIIIPVEDSNYANLFLKKSAEVLPEEIDINKYIIKLEKSKQPLYKPIYSLELVELKTLKIYIKTNLTNDFIFLSKSLVGAAILLVCKSNDSFCLCVDY